MKSNMKKIFRDLSTVVLIACLVLIFVNVSRAQTLDTTSGDFFSAPSLTTTPPAQSPSTNTSGGSSNSAPVTPPSGSSGNAATNNSVPFTVDTSLSPTNNSSVFQTNSVPLNTNVNSGSSNYSSSGGSGKNLKGLIGLILNYLNQSIYLLIAVAVVMFVFYVIKYFIAPSDGSERKEAGKYVMYAIIGFFVILSLWGLVNILMHTFNFSNSPQSWSSYQSMFPTQ